MVACMVMVRWAAREAAGVTAAEVRTEVQMVDVIADKVVAASLVMVAKEGEGMEEI